MHKIIKFQDMCLEFYTYKFDCVERSEAQGECGQIC